MKKIYALLATVILFTGFAKAQCTVNASAQTTPGVNIPASQLPCIHPGVAYSQTLQVKIQQSYDTTIIVEAVHIQVDSVKIDSVSGLPSGISFSHSPVVLLGGGNGCGIFSGTTNAAAGQYNLTAWGTAWLHATGTTPIAIDTPYAYNGNLNQFSPFGNYYLTVCAPNSVNAISADLNKALSVYPNPNNGTFEVKLNGGSRVNGELKIIDVTGRVVYSQNLDVVGFYNTTVDLTKFSKGMYTVQLRTAEGFASKNISVD